MSKSTPLSQSSRRDMARTRLAASTKYFAKKSVLIDGEELSGKDLAQVFQEVLATEDAVDSTKATYREAISTRKAAAQKSSRIVSALEGIVSAAFGPTSKAYAEFGFTPRKVADKSAATKALAVEKLLATRAARHTMGSRQKAAIHGDVVSSPSQAATPPSPPTPSLPAAPPPPAPAATPSVAPSPAPQMATLSLNGVNQA